MQRTKAVETKAVTTHIKYGEANERYNAEFEKLF